MAPPLQVSSPGDALDPTNVPVLDEVDPLTADAVGSVDATPHGQALTPPDLAGAFRDAFRGYPAGVAIIVGERPGGPVGVLVSSLASVSAVPPIVSLSISDASNAGQALLQADDVAVYMLTRHDIEVARHFAQRNRTRSDDEQVWLRDEHGIRLPTHGAVLHGHIGLRERAGSAVLLSVEVESIDLPDAPENHPGGLVHYDRRLHVVQRPTELG